MPKAPQSLGKWGEDLAARYLEQKSYRIIARNFRSSHGEIDIIAQDGDALVFIEVKTRSGRQFGFPENSVTEKKQIKLIETAESYLDGTDFGAVDWRIDVIAIQTRGGRPPEIHHLENVIAE